MHQCDSNTSVATLSRPTEEQDYNLDHSREKGLLRKKPGVFHGDSIPDIRVYHGLHDTLPNVQDINSPRLWSSETSNRHSPHVRPFSWSALNRTPYGSPFLPHLGTGPSAARLYVGDLSPRITEDMLMEIFTVAGPVRDLTVIANNMNNSLDQTALNHAFVEFKDMRGAEKAFKTFQSRRIFDVEIKITWANQEEIAEADATAKLYKVRVSNISPEVTSAALQEAFGVVGSRSLSGVRVMRDGQSRGFAFLTFHEEYDAEHAIAVGDGQWLGSSRIRVGLADDWKNIQDATAVYRMTSLSDF
jgi:hypothetical protein